jgi:hypothetical protein
MKKNERSAEFIKVSGAHRFSYRAILYLSYCVERVVEKCVFTNDIFYPGLFENIADPWLKGGEKNSRIIIFLAFTKLIQHIGA